MLCISHYNNISIEIYFPQRYISLINLRRRGHIVHTYIYGALIGFE